MVLNSFVCLEQTIATFFSQVMTAIGGTSAGAGWFSSLTFCILETVIASKLIA